MNDDYSAQHEIAVDEHVRRVAEQLPFWAELEADMGGTFVRREASTAPRAWQFVVPR